MPSAHITVGILFWLSLVLLLAAITWPVLTKMRTTLAALSLVGTVCCLPSRPKHHGSGGAWGDGGGVPSAASLGSDLTIVTHNDLYGKHQSTSFDYMSLLNECP